MMENKKYWKGLEELNNTPEFEERASKEFPDYLPMKESSPSNKGESEDSSRRDFLKLMGFSLAAATLAACEAPTKYAIPYVVKPTDVDPGIANYYASTYYDGNTYSSVMVKTREGRPIYLEGNKLSKVTQGGVDTQVLASLLSLYDSSRLKNFTKKGAKISKEEADKDIMARLSEASNIRIVSNSIISPSTKSVIKDFKTKFPNTKHVSYDPISYSGLREANGGIIPSYDFSKANVIVSFSADFLCTWLSSIEFSKQYAINRKLRKGKDAKQDMSRHYQFESILSLTGSNADIRKAIKPSKEVYYLTNLYNKVASAVGASTYSTTSVDDKVIEDAANDLLANKGKSLIVSGSNDPAVQRIVASLNELLGNVGKTVLPASPYNFKQGNDAKMANFVAELKEGKVDAVIFYNANPVYNYPAGEEIAAALKNTALTISFADRSDETASYCEYICPDYHPLESWGDAEPKAGSYSTLQPTISPIFKDTRAAQESLLTWTGNSVSYYDYVRNYWKNNIYTKASSGKSFDQFWIDVVHDGVLELKNASAVVEADEVESFEETEEVATTTTNVSSAFSAIASNYDFSTKEIELVLYETSMLGNGLQANNPWLHELPDPISKVCWDNYLAVPISMQTEFPEGSVAKVLLKGKTKTNLPVLVQPGQAPETVAVAVGYGRKSAGKLTENSKLDDKVKIKNVLGEDAIGVDVYPFVTGTTNLSYSTPVTVSSAGGTYKLAQTQTHHTIMGRANVQEAKLSEYKKDPKAGRVITMLETSNGKQAPNTIDIWSTPAYDENGNPAEVLTHKYENHHWGLVIDLNSCTGCSACMVACQVENNVPVVGKDEVIRARDMHWLRIDRYYSSDAEMEHGKYNAKNEAGYNAMENPSEFPQVTFQPMMCQHCNHAPCETVCPVVATTHSSEGLNQMTYNRCIGTRYCANNCPYKVRRFNWFSYPDSTSSDRQFRAVNVPANDDLGKMVLNPDVTVRARGVMEKCSMCVQRIQAGKLKARSESRKVKDGDIEVACASSCSTGAIIFGDMNDPESRISKALHEENSDRSFHVLEEINVKPNVAYLTKIRNI